MIWFSILQDLHLDLLSTLNYHQSPKHFSRENPDHWVNTCSQVARVHEEGREREEEEDDAPGQGDRSHRDLCGDHSTTEDCET